MYDEKVSLEKPNPPVVGRTTHYNVYLDWSQVKEYIPPKCKKYRFKVQELAHNSNKNEWTTVYVGYGICTTVSGCEPFSEYSYRLLLISPENKKSEWSLPVKIRTSKEPINCELFHKAIFFDKRNEVISFLEKPDIHKLFDIPDRLGNTALMIAVARDHIELVELFIECGINVNHQNESLKTALMLAAFHGKLHMVKVLRQHEACYDIRDNSGMTALHYAVDGGHCDTIEYMLNDGCPANEIDSVNRWTPLLRAASLNATENVARVLIKYGALLNVEDIHNKSALMIAVINGNLPFVQTLVMNGADIYTLNEDGKSLYDLALSMDRRNVIKFLEDYSEQKNIKYRRSRPSIFETTDHQT